ncbi:hypothetical protein QBC34DRAFT_426389 [Podospora aff. communis PSN243]|uniref:Uncharacterized protein n=1 Tax=Podospora aff. communis PSN243 TaxID=3040156 RepID=A0AAV9GJG7_9PEZI|nr:hypothetical protein QBC34DRAFT_426389 [Podospora aff. communis PSN243]
MAAVLTRRTKPSLRYYEESSTADFLNISGGGDGWRRFRARTRHSTLPSLYPESRQCKEPNDSQATNHSTDNDTERAGDEALPGAIGFVDVVAGVDIDIETEVVDDVMTVVVGVTGAVGVRFEPPPLKPTRGSASNIKVPAQFFSWHMKSVKTLLGVIVVDHIMSSLQSFDGIRNSCRFGVDESNRSGGATPELFVATAGERTGNVLPKISNAACS